MDRSAWMTLIGVVIITVMYVLTGGQRRPGVACPRCGSPLAGTQMASSWKEMLWGGRTCKSCLCEADGRERTWGS
jgi:hypothetical protein